MLILYGGTFDPVHDGHLAVARAARDALDAGVHLLPAADPPHRAPPGADAGQRAAMLELAIAGEPRLRVDRRELARGGPSYSVDTLTQVRAEGGQALPIVWLLGADAFRGLPSWHRWEALFELAHFAVATRPGFPLQALPPALQARCDGRWGAASVLRAAPAGRLFRLDLPLRDEAARAVRGAIAAGGQWHDDVPPAVAAYIRLHRLYGSGGTENKGGSSP